MALRNRFTATVGVLALLAGVVVAAPAAQAAVGVTPRVLINEVYSGGGNTGATLTNDFIELYNASGAAVDLSNWSVQYASATGTSWALTPLTGTLPAGSYYLINEAKGAGGTVTPTADVTGTLAMAGGAGKVALVNSVTTLSCGSTCTTAASVVDFVGFGATANDFAGTGATPAPSATTSVSRDASHTNTADNSQDFTAGAPSPVACGSACAPAGPVDVGEKTIAEIQGAGDTSPFAGDIATTKGVVTATYPTGGFNGYVIQTPGSGGDLDFGAHQSSNAIFVFSSATVDDVSIGDYVQVKGTVSEFSGLTEMTVDTGNLTVLAEAVAPVQPIANAWPRSEAECESIESMLFAGSGAYTITNTYSTNQYAEIGLAYGATPLMQPTDVARPNSQDALDIAADNTARGVVLDDGASINFLSAANSAIPLPYVSLTNPVRVGEAVTFGKNVIVDYRNSAWKLQPTSQVSAAAPGDYPATWTNNRTTGPDAAALSSGDLRVASFNVLNYFTTLGEDVAGCTSYNDRDGNGITTKSCPGNGPRGAWDAASLQRQQDKIVHAINALNADVIGLMEIENSLVVDGPGHADAALSTLVAALNADAGSTKWAFVPSSADLPPASEMDVITNAIIYQVASVDRSGDPRALGDQSGTGEAFVNAREPIAQAFTAKGGGTPFLLVVNHFKSKGSAGPLPGDQDSGDGQGSSNASRKAQATALNAWVSGTLMPETGVDDVFMTGDYNSYTMEDPLEILYDAGWTDLNSHYDTGKQSYSFGGTNGSLDHVLANASALARATGADIWNINAPESIALEYSRFNYNVTDFYDTLPYRSSDHDPVVAGFNSEKGTGPAETTVQILGINDFHGRISANGQEAGAAVLAGAVTDLRSDYPNTVFSAAGDLIGASTFESFIAHDKPTIDALNEAGLEVSSVGNHEFDQGYDDLINRVMAPYDATTNPYGGAQWKYLGANVKLKPSGDPALEATWVKEMNGVKVGFIGAVTEHLPELVSPAGIAGIEVTDIADSVNTEADALKADGVDIVVMLVHEGSPTSTCDAVTDESNDFGKIVNALDANVDAVISGHTHLTYNCMVPVPEWAGRAVTARPVVSAGQYGYNLDQLLFTVTDGEITAVESNTVPLTDLVPDPDNPGKTKWVANYDADSAVAATVAAAVDNAEVLGKEPLGEIGGQFNRAKLSSTSENRGGESTLGNLVAEAQRWATESPTTGSAQIAFMNPGGLRADMIGSNANGYPAELTYKQAATVQPFANTLINMTLTGAQIKTVLEQQWQPAGSSRPFLRLGMSDGFTYTYDPDAAAGSHITQMWLNADPIDAGTSYSVTVNSFLASGGDNFAELANGTSRKDTGQTDLQGMVDYMAANAPAGSPLLVDYTQRSVGVSYVGGADGYAGGDIVQFDLSSLAFSTAADVTDTQVSVSLNGTVLGSFAVDNTIGSVPNDEYGTAHVSLTIPLGTPVGTAVFKVAGNNTGTATHVPVGIDTLTFTDVVGNPFADDIAWLAATGITTGFPNGSFKPGAPVERQAMAAFLYRYTHPGQADPVCTGPTRLFVDVDPSNQFCGDIEWMKTAGITNGYNGGTEFHPADSVERQAMGAFLYRVQHPGQADPVCTGTTRLFTDVDVTNQFCGSIEWMKNNGITTGDGPGTFKPVKSVERQAMAAFLHRMSLLPT